MALHFSHRILLPFGFAVTVALSPRPPVCVFRFPIPITAAAATVPVTAHSQTSTVVIRELVLGCRAQLDIGVRVPASCRQERKEACSCTNPDWCRRRSKEQTWPDIGGACRSLSSRPRCCIGSG